MDPTEQLPLAEATGWRRGLYEDVMSTFRAPVVNSIWRTLVANRPVAARHLWHAVKPVFETRAFAAFTVRYRDAVLDALGELPQYDPGGLGLSPSAFAALRGQLATFDIVAPRLAALFTVCDRALNGTVDGVRDGHAATAPFPAWLDADRGEPVTLAASGAAREAAPATVEAVDGFHGTAFLPSIYRCLAQWPSAFERLWAGFEPVRESGYDAARARADDLADAFAARPPTVPVVTPATLTAAGVDDGAAAHEALSGLFSAFAAGAGGVLPLLHGYAAAVDATGERGWRLPDPPN
jgi:hypothetical protein